MSPGVAVGLFGIRHSESREEELLVATKGDGERANKNEMQRSLPFVVTTRAREMEEFVLFALFRCIRHS